MGPSDTDRFREFVQKLQQEDERVTALNEIKNLLTFKPAGESAQVIRNVGITKILQCVNLPEKSQVDLTCEVLRLCFEKLNTGDAVKNYTSHIMYLLRHDKECVRKLAIDEVYKTVVSTPEALPVPQYVDVFVAVAHLVADENVGISNKAVLITSNLPAPAYPKVLDEMKIALDQGSSSKCNAYEVVTNISAKSPELLALSFEHGYIEHMLSELSSNDVLYQLNILELLSRLAIKPHGINFLVESRALDKISENILGIKDNAFAPLLLPGYMKFFGCIAHQYPQEIFKKYPVLLNTLWETFNSADLNLLPVALDTLGFIGTTVEGKLSLAATGCKFTQTVQKTGELMRASTTDLKVRALHCMSNLIGYEKDPTTKSGPIDHRVTLMTREWFRSLSTTPESTQMLHEICKNPFPEISEAAYALLDAVTQHRWGEELVARTPGLIEYLLDRSTGQSKEIKEVKFGIIRRLCGSSAFEPSVMEKLTAYVQKGPFFSEPSLEVAMDEGN